MTLKKSIKLKGDLIPHLEAWWENQEGVDLPWVGDDFVGLLATQVVSTIAVLRESQDYLRSEEMLSDG